MLKECLDEIEKEPEAQWGTERIKSLSNKLIQLAEHTKKRRAERRTLLRARYKDVPGQEQRNRKFKV